MYTSQTITCVAHGLIRLYEKVNQRLYSSIIPAAPLNVGLQTLKNSSSAGFLERQSSDLDHKLKNSVEVCLDSSPPSKSLNPNLVETVEKPLKDKINNLAKTTIACPNTPKASNSTNLSNEACIPESKACVLDFQEGGEEEYSRELILPETTIRRMEKLKRLASEAQKNERVEFEDLRKTIIPHLKGVVIEASILAYSRLRESIDKYEANISVYASQMVSDEMAVRRVENEPALRKQFEGKLKKLFGDNIYFNIFSQKNLDEEEYANFTVKSPREYEWVGSSEVCMVDFLPSPCGLAHNEVQGTYLVANIMFKAGPNNTIERAELRAIFDAYEKYENLDDDTLKDMHECAELVKNRLPQHLSSCLTAFCENRLHLGAVYNAINSALADLSESMKTLSNKKIILNFGLYIPKLKGLFIVNRGNSRALVLHKGIIMQASLDQEADGFLENEIKECHIPEVKASGEAISSNGSHIVLFQEIEHFCLMQGFGSIFETATSDNVGAVVKAGLQKQNATPEKVACTVVGSSIEASGDTDKMFMISQFGRGGEWVPSSLSSSSN